jgi:hypothetical protein
VRRSGQWLHGGQGRGGVGRQCKAGDGDACSIQHREEDENWLGWVGQKAEQAFGVVGPTRPEVERISFLK